MSLILDGSVGVSDVDGSAATPAIRGTDANTGMFFPAADTIAFSEGGVESMRLTSAGDLLVGTTSSGYRFIASKNGAASVVAASSDTQSTVRAECGAAAVDLNTTGSTGELRTATNSPLVLSVNNTERMRITSGGYLLVGATTTVNQHRIVGNASGLWALVVQNNISSNPLGQVIQYEGAAPNGTGNQFLYCGDNAALRAEIRSNGGLANYSGNNVNLSDAREKTNINLANAYLDKICAIPVKTFNYIDQNKEEDDGLTLGVIAQDVQAVAPELVMESDWSKEKDGSKMRLSIYQTDLQYALMKSIQELKAIVDAQAAEIALLKSK